MTSPPAWRNPGISLGARCVLLAKAELQSGVRAPAAPRPNTSPRIAEYFRGCWRDRDGDGRVGAQEYLGLTAGNWCAAFASWCLDQCLLDGEARPHHYRAGVVEIVADARTRGLYRSADEVRRGAWEPHVGDLVIWDRSEPGKPETSWWRHVNRVVAYGGMRDGQPRIVTIGGNESRTIREVDQPPKALAGGKLLGFVSYYNGNAPMPRLRLEHDPDDLKLVSAFVEAHRRTLPKGTPA